MQGLVDGVLYDTDADNVNKIADAPEEHDSEALYLTESGRWFVASGSDFGAPDSGEINPIDEAEAYEWVESRDLVDVARKHFSSYFEKA